MIRLSRLLTPTVQSETSPFARYSVRVSPQQSGWIRRSELPERQGVGQSFCTQVGGCYPGASSKGHGVGHVAWPVLVARLYVVNLL